MAKDTGDNTPKRKRQRAVERDQDEASKPVRSLDPSSPLAQRMRVDQERMRRIGEKSGLKQFAEAVRRRNAKTAPPRPQEPTPQRRKRGRAGRKRSIAQEKIDDGISILQSQPRMSTDAARATLRAAGIEGEDGPLYRLIIKPAYGGMSK